MDLLCGDYFSISSRSGYEFEEDLNHEETSEDPNVVLYMDKNRPLPHISLLIVALSTYGHAFLSKLDFNETPLALFLSPMKCDVNLSSESINREKNVINTLKGCPGVACVKFGKTEESLVNFELARLLCTLHPERIVIFDAVESVKLHSFHNVKLPTARTLSSHTSLVTSSFNNIEPLEDPNMLTGIAANLLTRSSLEGISCQVFCVIDDGASSSSELAKLHWGAIQTKCFSQIIPSTCTLSSLRQAFTASLSQHCKQSLYL